MIQESRGRSWGRVCSINTLLRGTGSLWWLILWVASSHHEICEGCLLLPFRSKLDLKTRHLCPSRNLMSDSLNLELASFHGENKHKIISWKTTYTASWRPAQLQDWWHQTRWLLTASTVLVTSQLSSFFPPSSMAAFTFLLVALLSSPHCLCLLLPRRKEKMREHQWCSCSSSPIPPSLQSKSLQVHQTLKEEN